MVTSLVGSGRITGQEVWALGCIVYTCVPASSGVA